MRMFVAFILMTQTITCLAKELQGSDPIPDAALDSGYILTLKNAYTITASMYNTAALENRTKSLNLKAKDSVYLGDYRLDQFSADKGNYLIRNGKLAFESELNTSLQNNPYCEITFSKKPQYSPNGKYSASNEKAGKFNDFTVPGPRSYSMTTQFSGNLSVDSNEDYGMASNAFTLILDRPTDLQSLLSQSETDPTVIKISVQYKVKRGEKIPMITVQDLQSCFGSLAQISISKR